MKRSTSTRSNWLAGGALGQHSAPAAAPLVPDAPAAAARAPGAPRSATPSLSPSLPWAEPAILTVDGREGIVTVNSAAETLFGWPANQLLGHPVGKLIPQRLRMRHEAGMAAMRTQEGLRTRVFGESISATGQRRDGSEFPLELRIAPGASRTKPGPDAAPEVYRVEVRDLSPVDESQAQIAQLKRRFRDLVTQLPSPACIVEQAQVLYANPAFAALMGLSDATSASGLRVADVLSARTAAALTARARALAAGESISTALDDHIQPAPGVKRHIELHTMLLDASHGSLLVMLNPLAAPGELGPGMNSLHSQSGELRELSDRLMEAREDERRRIARELHDELGQQLSALKMSLSRIAQAGDLSAVSLQAQAAQQMIDGIVSATRRIAADLRPLMLDDLGLNSAIEWLAREVEKRGRLRIHLQVDPCGELVGEPHATGLYRMVQEALTNVERHAQATEVTVELRRTRHEISLCVRDDGIGFALGATRKSGSHGLLGLRERARMLGGILEIDNLPGGGGSVSVRLPLGQNIAP